MPSAFKYVALVFPTVEAADVEQPAPTRLIVRKSLSPKKPLVVTAMPTDSNKNVHEKLLKSAQLKGVNSTAGHKSPMEQVKEIFQDTLSEEGNMHDDDSDTQSDHRSVLEEERTLYRVKTKKIRLQIDNLKNSIEKQDLEKRKLQLEIKLLRMQVDQKESQAKQGQSVPDKQKKT